MVKNPPAKAGNAKRHRFHSLVRKILWSRKWQLTPVFLPGKFHGQRSLAGYSPWGHKELAMTVELTQLVDFSFTFRAGGRPSGHVLTTPISLGGLDYGTTA